MADVDEDKFHPDALDGDADDDTPDFRSFSAFLNSKSTTLPKRGEKDFEPHGTNAQADVLAASRRDMHTALSHMRVHRPDRYIRAFYNGEIGLTRVENPKSKLFQAMGKTDNRGVTWLLPEEALYLLERGDIDVRWRIDNNSGSGTNEGDIEGKPEIAEKDDLSFSLQMAYAVYIGDTAKGTSLERYNVYANLKRAGFAVFRGPAWEPDDHRKDVVENRAAPLNDTPRSSWSWIYELIRRDYAFPPNGPLLSPGPHRSYANIYRRLKLTAGHDPTQPTLRETGDISGSQDTSLRVSYYVYKPREGFKKSSPGAPDFRVVIVDAKEANVPTIEALDGLFSSTPYAPPSAPGNSDNAGRMYARLKHGYRNVIIAVVDQGLISYLRLADAGFCRERLYDGAGRSSLGNRGKRGGPGGRGRGGRGKSS